MYGLGNTFGKSSTTYNGGQNVWHEVKGQYPVGGTIALTGYSLGDVIKAGSMCYLNKATGVITIVKKTDSANLTNVNGLLMNDIYVDENAKGTNGAITGSVVFAGEIYVDRVDSAVYDSATIKSNLPMIVEIKG